MPLVFPVYPRTRRRLEQFGINLDSMSLVEPVGYIEFLGLMARACVVFTDSGGVQEETTALGVPCVTMRTNTERPITVQLGTNRLSGIGKSAIVNAAHGAVLHKRSAGSCHHFGMVRLPAGSSMSFRHGRVQILQF